MDSTHRVPATLGLPRTGVSVLSPSILLRLLAVLYGAGPVLSVVPVVGSSTKAWIWFHLCVVSSLASAVQASRGLRPSPRARCAFSLYGKRLGQPETCTPPPWVRRLFPPLRAAQAARGLRALSPGTAHLFPPRPQRMLPVRSQEVFRQEPGACLQCGRGWLLWG